MLLKAIVKSESGPVPDTDQDQPIKNTQSRLPNRERLWVNWPTMPHANTETGTNPSQDTGADAAQADPRLPTTVVPRHYEIELSPDLDAALFTGLVAIDVDITEATDSIVCNAADLDIHEASITTTRAGASSRAGAPRRTEALAVDINPASERITLTRVSSAGNNFEAGRAKLHISFSGILNDQLRGFYRSTFTDDNGNDCTVAVTQFEATDARRAFPCWDEPAAKATFAVSLVVDDGLLAISNGSETGREPAGRGKTRVSFATTMPMSTYLVACVVGPLRATKPVNVRGVPVRVVHRPGRGDQAVFALEVAAHALNWFCDYYDMEYPSDKLDLVAIPDFGFGAMENQGCVTFREVLLLIDPDTATQAEMQRVTDVINHELAHMWFGNLVTMAWWDGLWLNEAFASFMETSCTDAFKPEWRAWSAFGESRSRALQVDALGSTRPIEHPVVTPDDAEDMFDVLTYQKGRALLRMLEQYLGADAFKAGVRVYLRRHAHANTRNSDLWDALEEASDEPVRAIMDSWISQGGHPLVRASVDDSGVTLSQRHFTLKPELADDRLWQVPVRMRVSQTVGTDPAGTLPEEDEHRILLDSAHRTLAIRPDSVVTVNSGASGFFRSDLGPGLLAEITASGAPVWSDCSDERLSLLEDAWALTLSGHLDIAVFADLALDGFISERDPDVWRSLAHALRHMKRILYGNAAQYFGELVVAATSEAFASLTWEPRTGEDDRTRELRSLLVQLRGMVAEHAETVEACRERLDHSDPALAAAALSVTARHGDSDDFQSIRQRFENATDPQSEQRHLSALADFPDPELLSVILAGTLDGTVRTQDGPYLLCRALANPDAGERAWTFLTGNWEKISRMFPSQSLARMLEGVTALDRPESAADVTCFLEEHPIPQGAKQVEQHLERLAVNTAFRSRSAPPLTKTVLKRR